MVFGFWFRVLEFGVWQVGFGIPGMRFQGARVSRLGMTVQSSETVSVRPSGAQDWRVDLGLRVETQDLRPRA